VVTITLPEQRKDVTDLLKMAKINMVPMRVSAKSEEVVALIGEVAPYVKPVAEAPKPQGGGGTSTGRNAQRKRALKQAGPAQPKSGRPSGQGGNQERSAKPARPANANRNRQRSR
jgi:hypothetical protein